MVFDAFVTTYVALNVHMYIYIYMNTYMLDGTLRLDYETQHAMVVELLTSSENQNGVKGQQQCNILQIHVYNNDTEPRTCKHKGVLEHEHIQLINCGLPNCIPIKWLKFIVYIIYYLLYMYIYIYIYHVLYTRYQKLDTQY